MNTAGILTIVRKELRTYFLSPVALIFLAVFLVAVLVDFFFLSTFFTRNLADVRPLFSALPFLLIFLVSAITMRQWSEEQKMGTLEVLLTLPLKTSHLVLSKFLAGMALVALALAFGAETLIANVLGLKQYDLWAAAASCLARAVVGEAGTSWRVGELHDRLFVHQQLLSNVAELPIEVSACSVGVGQQLHVQV